MKTGEIGNVFAHGFSRILLHELKNRIITMHDDCIVEKYIFIKYFVQVKSTTLRIWCVSQEFLEKLLCRIVCHDLRTIRLYKKSVFQQILQLLIF